MAPERDTTAILPGETDATMPIATPSYATLSAMITPAIFLTAAEDEWLERNAFAHEQSADAFRTFEFMRGKRERVNA